MNTSFWSQCRGLINRLKQRRAVPRLRRTAAWAAESLENRMLLSSTPAMIADIAAGANSSNPSMLVTVGSTTFFNADDGVHGLELWKTDGTAAGTMMVKDINPGSGSANIVSSVNVNGTFYFAADDGVHGTELWKSDGTAAGTTMIKDIFQGQSSGYYGPVLPKSSLPFNLTAVNGTLFFSAEDGNGRELWKSDGTTAGTVMVKDIFPGGTTGYYGGYYVNSSLPMNLTNVNGRLFFTADDGALWVSDGTSGGTNQVSTLPFQPRQLTNVNGTLFFSAYGWPDGQELWKSDGTAAGTTLVKDIYPGQTKIYGYYGGYSLIPNDSNPQFLTAVNGTLYFMATDPLGGGELWKSDGTDAGTVIVKDIRPGSTGSYPGALTNVNGTLYFRANDGVHGQELWTSDGTAAGTGMIKDINSGSSGSYLEELTAVNGMVYFRAFDTLHGPELWKTDGTTAGTTLVADVNPDTSPSFNLTVLNQTLLFTDNDGVHGVELWALNTIPTPSLDMSGFPVTVTAGASGSITVTAQNADGTTNTSFTGKIHFTSSDPKAVLPADYTFTAADQGRHTFSATLKTAGTQSISATDVQTQSNSGSITNIQVKAASASSLSVSGFPSTITAGLAGTVTVTLKDVYGNTATGYTGTVRFTSNDPQAVLPANYTFTSADAGKHSFSVTLKTAGTRSITVTDTVLASLTATQSGITVKAGAAKQFLLSGPTSVTAGVPFSLTLTVKDAYGNVVTGYTGTVRFTSSDRRALLPADYTFTAADNGAHTFTGIVLRKKGNQTVSVTDKLNSALSSTFTTKVR